MVESSPPIVFNVNKSDLVKDYGWAEKKDEIKIDCSFPLKCEVTFESETQKTHLVVTLITEDPNSNNTFSIDFFDTAKDLVSMGYIESSDYDDFIDHIVTNSPNKESLNYLDNTGTTIDGYSGRFELQKCVNQYGDFCAIAVDPQTNKVIAEIPVDPINELEFAIKQRNITITPKSTSEAKRDVTYSGIGSAIFLSACLTLMVGIRYKWDLWNEKIAARKEQEGIDNHNREIENIIAELTNQIEDLQSEKE